MNNYRLLVIDDVSTIHDDFRKILLPNKQSSVSHQSLDEVTSTLTGKLHEGAQHLPPFVIDFAFQGNDGVRLVQQSLSQKKPYAVAFVDVQMPPGEDGIETIANIWKLDPEIQCIICTAYAKYSWDEIQKSWAIQTACLF